ncbi:MAG TPA: ATP-binding protein [Candidatus Solibacter sp.]|nr:ATP-binding protein [Candidatus Solibacter sp.]
MTAFLRRTRMRLALAYAGIFSVVAIVAAAALWLALSRTEYSSIDDSLAGAARGAESALVTRGTPPSAGDDVLPPPASGEIPVGELVFSRTGTVLQHNDTAPSSSALGSIATTAASSSSPALSTQTIDGESQRILSTRVELRSGDSVVIVVTRSLAETNRLLFNAGLVLVVGMAMLVVAAAVVGYGLAGAALRPVREIASTARNFSERDLHRRLELDLPPDELGELADTFNGMLARMETAFESLRRFTADAAHELRAPLTMMRTEAEVTLSKPRTEKEYRASLQTMLSEAERLGRLADQLLLLARADAGALNAQMTKILIPGLVAEAGARWRSVAARHDVTILDEVGSQGYVWGDVDLMTRLLDNLIDNALRHTPDGGTVTLSVAAVDSWWEIAVADSGPGVDPGLRDLLFERFARADPARRRDTGGAGLGLALCAVIARLHNGSISLDAGAPQGARFVVRLPAAEPPAA